MSPANRQTAEHEEHCTAQIQRSPQKVEPHGWCMYYTLNGTNTNSVITSCIIFSCGNDSCPKPMRLAGTWIRYSKNAILQLARTAIKSGLCPRLLRCPYHANVIKTFDATSNKIVETIGFIDDQCEWDRFSGGCQAVAKSSGARHQTLGKAKRRSVPTLAGCQQFEFRPDLGTSSPL